MPTFPAAKVAAALTKVRALCAALPEVTERPSHGSPTFFVRGKTFAYFLNDHHGDGRLAIWCKATHEAQGDLVAADPDHFFVPPYVGPRGWLGIRLDRGKTDWSAVAALLGDAWRLAAPKRLLAAPPAPPKPPRPARAKPPRPARAKPPRNAPAKPTRNARR